MTDPYSQFGHEVNPHAEGVVCGMCRINPATHKIGEEDVRQERHNFTTYVCCSCFGIVMGKVAARWCGI